VTAVEPVPVQVTVTPGNRLDADHFPETNGWMAVCRRCGFRTTTGASDHHEPMTEQTARVTRWLDGQRQAARIAAVRSRRDT